MLGLGCRRWCRSVVTSTLARLTTLPSSESPPPSLDNVVYLRRRRKPERYVSSPPSGGPVPQVELHVELVNNAVAVLNDTVYLEDLPEKLAVFRGKLTPRDVAMVLKCVRDLRLAYGFFNWVKEQPDAPYNLDVFLTMVHRLLVSRKWEELNSVVDWMHEKSFYLHFGLFEAVIKEASDAQQADVCEKWYKLMHEINVKPNVFIYNLMIRAYSRQGRNRDALLIFQDMEDNKVKPTVVTYSQLFSVCKDIGESKIAKLLLNKMRVQGIQPDPMAYTTLMNVYAKAGQPEEAEALFVSMQKSGIQPDVYLLNCLLDSYVKAGNQEQATSLFKDRLLGSGHPPNEATYVIMLGLYCKACRYDEAFELIRTMDHESMKLGEQFFITLIKAFSEAERWDDTIRVFKEMEKSSCRIRGSIYVLLLEVCFKAGYNELCVEFFSAVLDKGINRTPGVYETMIRAYERMNRMVEVGEVFVYMQNMLCPFTRDVYDLLHGIFTRTKNSEMLEALEKSIQKYLKQMAGAAPLPPPDPRNFLKHRDEVVGNLSDTCLGWMKRMEDEGRWWAWAEVSPPPSPPSRKQRITRRSRLSSTSPGETSSRREMHDFEVPVGGFRRHIELRGEVDRLEFLDDVSEGEYASLLKKCGGLKALELGRRVHEHIQKCNRSGERFLANLLVEMYGKCESLEEARAVFNGIARRNLFSWNIILAAYAQNGYRSEVLALFGRMRAEYVQPDKFTYSTVISACSTVDALEDGRRIHAIVEEAGLDSETVVGTSLINMYGKCHSLEDARPVFDRISCKDPITWNAMITAYAQDGCGRQALQFYQVMLQEGVKTGPATFLSVLDACASMSSLALGRMIHTNLAANGLETDLLVGTALVNMYAKCGKVVEARDVFDRMKERDVVAWTAMVAGYAQHGHITNSKQLMRDMELEGMKANSVTFLTLVFACSHAGLLYEARDFFISMGDHGIPPLQEHFRCMIDLLGRGGRLHDAQELVQTMPYEPGMTAWLSMLSACRLQGDIDRAEFAAEQCYELEPRRPSAYILICNMYAAVGRWDDVERIKRLMEVRGVKKEPGLSSIEVKNRLHEFGAGDRSHPQRELIYEELRKLTRRMKEAGYVPDTSLVSHKVDEETKETMLSQHSERLAVAYGLISTPPRSSLCIVNNLRVCSDCHTAFKLISSITGRQIVVRDTNRFHSFCNGDCSCNDYW